MRVAVVGCGYWGSKHVRVFQGLEAVEEVVAVDGREERRRQTARAVPGVRTAPSLYDVMDQVDAVVVATPPSSHAPIALDAISAGKHVLVEKPFSTSVTDGERMIAAAEQADVRLMVGHTFAYNAAVTTLRDIVQRPEFGHIHYLHTARLNLGLYQSDVSVTWDLAPHDISIANFVLGRTPQAVQAWGSSHVNSVLPDVAYLRLDYGDNVTTQVHVSWLDPCKVRRVTVVGSEQMAVYDDMADDERVRVYDQGVIVPPRDDLASVPMSYRHGGIVAPYVDFREPLAVQDQHFVDCIRDGTTPLTDGRAGLAVVQVLEAADRALASHQPEAVGTHAPQPANTELVGAGSYVYAGE